MAVSARIPALEVCAGTLLMPAGSNGKGPILAKFMDPIDGPHHAKAVVRAVNGAHGKADALADALRHISRRAQQGASTVELHQYAEETLRVLGLTHGG